MELSVIIPLYNVEPDLFRICMKSLLAEQPQDCEIIVVDDGSTNGAEKVCDEYAIYGVRVKHQANEGVAVARNTGIEMAKGRFLTFIDPDDLVPESFYETLYSAIKEADANNFADAVFFAYQDLIGETLTNRIQFQTRKIWQGADIKSCIISGLDAILPGGDNTFVTVWGSLYRSTFLNGKGIQFKPKLRKVQDLIFNLDVLQQANCILYIPQSMYIYRCNPDSICHKYNPNIAKYYSFVMEELLDFASRYSAEDYEINEKVENWKLFFIVDIVNLDLLNEDSPKQSKEKAMELYHLIHSPQFSKPEKLHDNAFYRNRSKLGKIMIDVLYTGNYAVLITWRIISNFRNRLR